MRTQKRTKTLIALLTAMVLVLGAVSGLALPEPGTLLEIMILPTTGTQCPIDVKNNGTSEVTVTGVTSSQPEQFPILEDVTSLAIAAGQRGTVGFVLAFQGEMAPGPYSYDITITYNYEEQVGLSIVYPMDFIVPGPNGFTTGFVLPVELLVMGASATQNALYSSVSGPDMRFRYYVYKLGEAFNDGSTPGCTGTEYLVRPLTESGLAGWAVGFKNGAGDAAFGIVTYRKNLPSPYFVPANIMDSAAAGGPFYAAGEDVTAKVNEIISFFGITLAGGVPITDEIFDPNNAAPPAVVPGTDNGSPPAYYPAPAYNPTPPPSASAPPASAGGIVAGSTVATPNGTVTVNAYGIANGVIPSDGMAARRLDVRGEDGTRLGAVAQDESIEIIDFTADGDAVIAFEAEDGETVRGVIDGRYISAELAAPVYGETNKDSVRVYSKSGSSFRRTNLRYADSGSRLKVVAREGVYWRIDVKGDIYYLRIADAGLSTTNA